MNATSPTYSPERTASRLALFREMMRAARILGAHVTMPIQAANDFCARCHLDRFTDLGQAINARVSYDLPGNIQLPCESTPTVPLAKS